MRGLSWVRLGLVRQRGPCHRARGFGVVLSSVQFSVSEGALSHREFRLGMIDRLIDEALFTGGSSGGSVGFGWIQSSSGWHDPPGTRELRARRSATY